MRQVGFDQVHTNFPTVTCDGRVIYTRWDYNDRGQIYPQGLFQMNPDGTGQRALYGNNSYFPTTLIHARSIPGTGKYVAIFTGHHTTQKGWLGIIDPAQGREENLGAQLIAPVRHTPAEHIDRYGQTGDQFLYPYPLNEREFLVSFQPDGKGQFGIYYIDQDGRRELLASDPANHCNQPIPVRPRPAPRRGPAWSITARRPGRSSCRMCTRGWACRGSSGAPSPQFGSSLWSTVRPAWAATATADRPEAR
jgi:hypothetical protein